MPQQTFLQLVATGTSGDDAAMEEPAKHMGVDMTLGQLGTSDHEGWLTDLTSGEQRWCVLVDLILCVFASDDETERPLKTLLLPGLRVRRLLFMSAHPGNVDVDVTSGHRSPNGITMSGMLRHQFAISDPVNDKVDVFGSQLLMEITKWIWKLEFVIAQQADITSQTNIDFRNDVCTLQSSVSDYIPSERTRMGNVDCCNNKLLVCRFNPFDRDGEQDELVHRPLRHTESNPPKRQGRRLVRTPSCPTETSWCEPSNGGYFSKDEQTYCNSRGAYSLVEHMKGTHCSRDDVSKAERRPLERSNALRRALSLSGVTSTNIHANLSKNEKAHGNSGSQHSLTAHSNGTLLEETDNLLDDIPKPDRRSPKRMGGLRRALSLSGIISTKTHTNDGKTRRNSRSQHSSAARKNGTLLEETDCSLDDVPEAARCSPKRKNGLRRALSLSGVISTKTHTNSTLGKMKHFVLGLKLKRRRSVSHTTLGESPLDDYKQAWSLDMLPDDPNTTLLGSTTADCATQYFGSDFGRSGMKTAFSESALNCDGKRRPRQRRGCRRSASVTSHMYEHRTEDTPKTVTFLTQHESEATAKDATRPNTVAFTRECSDSNQGGLQDAAFTSRTRQGKLRRRRSGLFRKAFFSSVFGFLRCTSGRHKGLGVTNCIGSRPTPWPETPSSTEEKTTCDVTNDHAVWQKSGQRKKHRRWDHPPLIGNFRSRSKSLIRSENDDHAYVDDLPLIQGYLYWLQSSAEWQRRWCVLKGNVLYRLATPSSDDVIDNFKLDVWAVKRWDSGTLHRRPFCCELIYDEFCSEFFSTDSEGELLIWLNRLERVTGCPAETTSSGLARRKTVTGATQPLHSTVRRVHSADSPFLQQHQQQLARDRLWLQKQQLLEEVLTQKTALERQQRKTILGRSCQKRQDTPSECSSNYDVAADTDILWHLRMKKTATKLKINDLERHLEACQEKTKYDMFKQDRPTTESSLIDEIDAVMTTDDLYRRLAELKLELAETDHDLKGFHYKALRNGQSMFLSQGNLNSHSLGCRCIYGKCDTGHEMRETRCRPERVAATSCINLTGVNTPHATIAATSPNEDGVQHNVQHNARQRLTRKPPPFSGLTPRRAYSLRDSLVPQPTPSNSGPTISSSIIRKPTFALAKAPVRRCDSDSAYTVTKNNRYPVIRPGPNGDVQRCWSPQQSTPFSKKECRPRIHGHAPLRRLAQTLGSCSIATYRDNLSVSPSGSHQENARNDPDEKKIVSTTLSKEQDYNSNVSTNLTLHSKEQDYSTKDDRSHRRQDSDARNDTITTYDSGVGTMSDNQDNRVDGPGSGWRESTDAPQTSWLRRRSASITGHLGVLPSKLKAFMPSKAHANDGWASDDNKRLSNPLATRVGDVDIDALSSKYKLRRATEGHRADAEHRNNGDCRRHGVLVDDTLTRTSNIGDKDDVDVAVLRDDVRRNHRVVPPGENGGRDCTVHRCRAVSNIGYSRQRSSSGGDIVTMNNISDTPSIRSHNTVKCGPSADFASVARKDTPHRRVTRSDVSPWTTAVDTKSRGSVCHHCGTVVSCGSERTHERMQERTQAPRCCTNGGDVTTPEISVEAMAHIAAFEKLIDDQLGLMSAARL